MQEKEVKGDRNPKDYILFFDSDYTVLSVRKDNTGQRGYYKDKMVFPTLSFPSDHAITSTVLEVRAGGAGGRGQSQLLRGGRG